MNKSFSFIFCPILLYDSIVFLCLQTPAENSKEVVL